MTDQAGGIAPGRPAGCLVLRRGVAIAVGLGILTAAVLAGVSSHGDGEPVVLTAGRVAAMLALALLMVQFALSGRWRLLDKAFGMDRLLRVHRICGPAAVVLATAHPLLVYAADHHGLDASAGDWAHLWPQLVGAAALVILWLIACTALWRTFLGLKYEQWRWIHRLAFPLVAVGLVHAFTLGSDLAGWSWVRLAWVTAAAAYAMGFVWVNLVRPIRLRRRRCTIRSVTHVNHNTINVELAPPAGRAFRYLPGQFAFLRFRGAGVAAQEHPFTISSSPTHTDAISFTIKQSGDFAATLDRLDPAGAAEVFGPFGRFSHILLLRDGEPLVMIAGGVGLTPMLSMLRYMADTGDQRPVTLIWANRTEADFMFRQEMDDLTWRLGSLAIHHVISRQADWPGHKGHIDAAMLGRLLGEPDRGGRALVCGPPGMMTSAVRALRKFGIRRRKIHTERFAL